MLGSPGLTLKWLQLEKKWWLLSPHTYDLTYVPSWNSFVDSFFCSWRIDICFLAAFTEMWATPELIKPACSSSVWSAVSDERLLRSLGQWWVSKVDGKVQAKLQISRLCLCQSTCPMGGCSCSSPLTVSGLDRTYWSLERSFPAVKCCDLGIGESHPF